MSHSKYLSSRIPPYPKAEKIGCKRQTYLRLYENSNASLKMLKTHYNKPRPATPSFIMMIATNTGSRPSNQLAILQQALKERVKKCVLLQNTCSIHHMEDKLLSKIFIWCDERANNILYNKCIHYSYLLSKAMKTSFYCIKTPIEKTHLMRTKVG